MDDMTLGAGRVAEGGAGVGTHRGGAHPTTTAASTTRAPARAEGVIVGVKITKSVKTPTFLSIWAREFDSKFGVRRADQILRAQRG